MRAAPLPSPMTPIRTPLEENVMTGSAARGTTPDTVEAMADDALTL